MDKIQHNTKRGGARPGAGRPCHGSGRKTPATFMLSPEGAAARKYLRDQGLDINAMVDAFLRRNTPALADSE
jgi:hypothetical protein